MSNSEKRKLAAVLFSDIKGYTAMVQENEDSALAKVQAHRHVLEENTAAHKGQLIAFYGDGSLSTYDSAIDAVNSAIAMQREFIEKDVPVRIGIHLGDIVFRDDSVFGDGVNVASRVQSEGFPGAVVISERLQQEIANRPDIGTKSIGVFSLKNVRKPVRIYALTSSGLYVPRVRRVSKDTGRKILLASILGLVLLALGYMLVKSGMLNSSFQSGDLRTDRVAVRFQDYSDVDERGELGAMASHWIGNRLSELPTADIVNYDEAVENSRVVMATASANKRREFANRTGAVNVLEGTIFKQGAELIFEAALINLNTGERLASFEIVNCESVDPMQCISVLTDRILGWWASKGDNTYSIPTYDAYKSYLSARASWREDNDRTRSFLITSIKSDPSFIDPYFLLAELYILQEDFVLRDSMIDLISTRFERLTPRQNTLLDVYKADRAGDLIKSYEKYQSEIEADPTDIFVNTGGMVQAILHANKPDEALALFDMIPVDSLDLYNCDYCHTRLRIAVFAYLAKGQYQEALDVVDMLPLTSIRNINLLLRVLLTTQDTSRINDILVDLDRQPDYNIYEDFYPSIAWHASLLGYDDMVRSYCNRALNNSDTSSANSVSVECNYLLGKYERVIELIEADWPLEKFTEYDYVLIYTSRAYAQSGDTKRIEYARTILNRLDRTTTYDYGKYLYMLGVMESILGNQDKAIDLLENAYYSGTEMSQERYQNDVDLMSLRGNPDFERLLTPLGQ